MYVYTSIWMNLLHTYLPTFFYGDQGNRSRQQKIYFFFVVNYCCCIYVHVPSKYVGPWNSGYKSTLALIRSCFVPQESDLTLWTVSAFLAGFSGSSVRKKESFDRIRLECFKKRWRTVRCGGVRKFTDPQNRRPKVHRPTTCRANINRPEHSSTYWIWRKLIGLVLLLVLLYLT
jgi:hypothetical protein